MKSLKCQLETATRQKSSPAQCEEQKGTVNDQEATAGSAGPSNPEVVAPGSDDPAKPTSISLPEDVLSGAFAKLDPFRKAVRGKMYEIVFSFINTGTAPEPQCLSSLAFGIYYLQKLKVPNLLEHFRVEDRGPVMEAMVAKILLKFGAAQATCRDDDDDITSHLFQTQHEKNLLRRMEPPLLMCVFND